MDKNKFAIIISIGRFEVDVFYVVRVGNKKEVFRSTSYTRGRKRIMEIDLIRGTL